ncbi:hypothetical protein [Streptomyces poriticola]|uniref:hypothetical protein n=1 Tax=Streptomyces poriticola TaxID=3120506 RepID=UPI002FCE0AA4
MISVAQAEAGARGRRAKHPVLLAIGIGCYALAAIVGMSLLLNHAGFMLLAFLWLLHSVLLTVLIRRLGAKESSTYAALFIVLLSAICAPVLDIARDDLSLQQHGEKVTATVAKERTVPAAGREGPHSRYTLEKPDGTRVRGPELDRTADPYDVGQVLTVIEDPEGVLAPQPVGDADATAELVGAGALALTAVGAVGMMAWWGSEKAMLRDAVKRGQPSVGQKVSGTLKRTKVSVADQETKLREALRTYPKDRRGYIKVHPEEFPGIPHARAARIAWEEGLRAEAHGNRGSWRFGETVLEEVAHE